MLPDAKYGEKPGKPRRAKPTKGPRVTRAKGLIDVHELLDVVGKPRKEVWLKHTKAETFSFDPGALNKLADFCGLNDLDSEQGRQLRVSFDVDVTKAARDTLAIEILDRGRPRRPRIKQAAIIILRKAKSLRLALKNNRWEISVGRILINEELPLLGNQLEEFLSILIEKAEEAIAKHRSGGTKKYFSTVPPRAFAGVFDKHVIIPPEGCSPRCSEATVMENIKAARRKFVKTALSELGISFTRPLQSALRKLPITDEAFQRILQQTR